MSHLSRPAHSPAKPSFVLRRQWKILSLAFFLLPLTPQAATVYYTFENGVAALEINGQNGDILSHHSISREISKPKKLAVSNDGSRVIVTSEDVPTAWICHFGNEPEITATLSLADATSEVRAKEDHALVADDQGMFYWIDLKSGQCNRRWNARDSLNPPGSKGEDIYFLPEENIVLLTFQKDGKRGRKGSRLAVLDLPDLSVRHDLPLPRNHPELHMDSNPKEQGPNPEMIIASPRTNTIALSLDLYGAIAFANLDAALAGEWKNLEMKPTSADGKFGIAFPDRCLLFNVGDRDCLLISNAGIDGGIALFDVAERRLLAFFEAPAGAEHPVHLQKSHKVLAVISGKIKERGSDGLEKSYSPGNELLVFDVGPLAHGKEATLERIGFEKPIKRIQAINPQQNDLVLLAFSDEEIMVYDVASRREITRVAAKGPISRMTVWHGKQASRINASETPAR